jgi:hypothetical protein
MVEALGGAPEGEKFFIHHIFPLYISFRGGYNKRNQEVNRNPKGAEKKVKAYSQGQPEAVAAEAQKKAEKNPPGRTNTQGQAQIPGKAQEEELGIVGKVLPGTGGVEKKGKKAEAEGKNDRQPGKYKKTLKFFPKPGWFWEKINKKRPEVRFFF